VPFHLSETAGSAMAGAWALARRTGAANDR
jgi:hypothetical protein